jgi:hypothetical protein
MLFLPLDRPLGAPDAVLFHGRVGRGFHFGQPMFPRFNAVKNSRLRDKSRRQRRPVAIVHARRSRKPEIVNAQELNKPLFGNAFCPLLGRKGASERLSSFSRKLGGL